jgi:hypothetical protein
MATILDAHPEVAMSYETYEHLLTPSEPDQNQLSKVLQKMAKPSSKSIRSVFFLKSSKVDSDFAKFVGRAERAGIDSNTLCELFKEHFDTGLNLGNFRNRMLFVERMTKAKAKREGKIYWGAKIVSTYHELDEMYPEARYLFMLRDGRDIASSRKKVGEFNQTIEHIADGWCQQIKKFERFASTTNGRAIFVPYERLVQDPARELRQLLEQIDLPWSDRVLAFHHLNLSIHRNPTGHLSGDQVKSPINTSSIGRWKVDLTPEEVARYEEHARPMLEKLGYL